MPSRTATEVIKSISSQRDLAISLTVVVLLSLDWLNPVKVLSVALGVPSRWAAYPCLILLGHLFLTHYREIVYDSVRVFFRSILSIFFKQVDIVGIDNIPKHGPIIFSGNHSNQFVDGVVVLTTAQHRVGFLIAEKSYNHPVVGFFAKLAGAVPVKRPQDSAKALPGNIMVKGAEVTGYGTTFLTDLKPGDKLRIKGQPDGYRIKGVESDTLLTLSTDEPLPTDLPSSPAAYEKLAKVDQSRVYNAVFDSLKKGTCIGIFPEGGSHDRTDLLPLKVGIALIAFGMAEKYNITVPIVPVGLNYFRGHRFRGRVVVEFGPPVLIPEELIELHRTNRKEAYQAFLSMVEDGMRATIVTAPNYHALHLLYTARRLFQKDNWLPSPSEKMDMNRRFAEGYKMLIQKYGDDLPDEMKQLEKRVMEYQKTLHDLGLRDYQVPTLEQDDTWKLLYTLLHLLLVWALAMLPSLILNAPVGLFASIVSTRAQKIALAASRVKIEAKDVVMSKKITLSIVLVPTLWIVYACCLLSFTNLKPATVAVLFLCCPLFSYIGVMATEAGMVDAKDLKPVFMRFLPSARKKMEVLPAERAQLQKDVRAFIHKVGPELGSLYTAKEVKWEEVLRRTASGSDLQALIDTAASSNHDASSVDMAGLAAAVNGRATPTPPPTGAPANGPQKDKDT